MKRRAYVLLVTNAVIMAVLAFVVSRALGYPLRDPDGFLGPAWVRLPLLCLAGFAVDIVPRTLWRSRGRPRRWRAEARTILDEHWSRQRVLLVVVGVVSFYAVYVSYRNLKNFLPFVRPFKYDYALHHLDHLLLLGHDPTLLLQQLLGTGVSAHVLSWIYLVFLPLVPITVCAWAVWSRNVSFGYWYITADCLAWSLGTASYFIIPTLGPNFAFPWLYQALDHTGVSALQDAIYWGRENIIHVNPFADGVQSVAGFASLHVAISLVNALVAQYTIRSRLITRTLWAYLVLVVLSTTYFGWHYIADDLAGAVIAAVSVYVGALATGQRFDRRGRSSHPTTTSSDVPIPAAD
ncbi:MAG: phosphatase PAP2 family protein [Marmoricola sp.]